MTGFLGKTLELISRFTGTSESADSAGLGKSKGRGIFSKNNRSNRRAATAKPDDRNPEASDHARLRRSTASSTQLEASDVQDSIRHKGTRRRRALSRESDFATYGRNVSHKPLKNAHHSSTNASDEVSGWTECIIPDVRVFRSAPMPPSSLPKSLPARCGQECLGHAEHLGQGIDDQMLKSTPNHAKDAFNSRGFRIAQLNARKQGGRTKVDADIHDSVLTSFGPFASEDMIADSTHELLGNGPVISTGTPESSWDDQDEDSRWPLQHLLPTHSRLSVEEARPDFGHDLGRYTCPGGSYPSIVLSGKGTVSPVAQYHQQFISSKNASFPHPQGVGLGLNVDGDVYDSQNAQRPGRRTTARASICSGIHADTIYDPVPYCRQLGRLRNTGGPWVSALTHLLTELSGEQIFELGHCYLELYGTLLTSEIKKRMNGCFQEICHAAALGPWSSEVFWIHQYGDPGYDKASQFLIEALVGRSNSDIEGINAASRMQTDKGHVLDSYVFRYPNTLSHLIHVALTGERQSEDVIVSVEEVKAFMLELRQAFRYQPSQTKELPIIDALLKKSDA
ncbi:hypothetical protein KEM54_002100, partial [Ascosphaera aggregata]